jgi:hypothetical protein
MIGIAEVDDHVGEGRATLRQNDHARTATAILSRIHRALATVATDRDRTARTELDRALAEHRIAQPARHSANEVGRHLGHLGRHAGGARPLRRRGRGPAAEQRVALGRKRRPLLPGSSHRLPLCDVGIGARLLLAHGVVPLLVGLLLARLLLLRALLGALLLGLLTQGTRVLAELLGRWWATLRGCHQHQQLQRARDADPAEKPWPHGRLLAGSPATGSVGPLQPRRSYTPADDGRRNCSC